ncbi:hypothetical protein Tco_0150392 [Tanacetum coccineum]
MARITDEIRQNENNANRRNGRHGLGNNGDAQSTDIHVWLERPKNEGDNKRDRDGHCIRPSKTPSRVDDRRDSDRYGNRGRHGNRDIYGTDRWRGDRQGSDRHGNGSDRQGNGSQKVWRDQDQQERRVTGLLVLALNVERLGIWLKIVRKVVRAAGENDLVLFRLRLDINFADENFFRGEEL